LRCQTLRSLRPLRFFLPSSTPAAVPSSGSFPAEHFKKKVVKNRLAFSVTYSVTTLEPPGKGKLFAAQAPCLSGEVSGDVLQGVIHESRGIDSLPGRHGNGPDGCGFAGE